MNDTEQRKKQILVSAQNVFMQKGYYKATIDDIANDVGIVRGTILHYFKSKEGLMEAVLDQAGIEFVKSVDAILINSNQSVQERIIQLKAVCMKQFQTLKPQLEQYKDKDQQFRFLVDQMRLKTYYKLSMSMKQMLDDGCLSGVFKIENTHARSQSVMFALFGITGADLTYEEMVCEFDCILDYLLYGKEE